MNKKFSTLVAALLASGGLFYAVDAMILPGSDGAAKYVMVETRADATNDQYLVKVDAYSEFATFWTAEDATADGAAGSFYLKTTEKRAI
ncbi:MAG: hypothetical protein LUD46_12415 [Parabacteroides sp.]|nr:hypothetical protein [Parabacteroides sp.]